MLCLDVLHGQGGAPSLQYGQSPNVGVTGDCRIVSDMSRGVAVTI